MVGKTKWKKLQPNQSLPIQSSSSTQQSSQTSILLQLHELYSEYIDMCVIDSIALDCTYNIDMCIDLLNDIVHTTGAVNNDTIQHHTDTSVDNVIDMTKISLNDDLNDRTPTVQPQPNLLFDDVPNITNLLFDDVPISVSTDTTPSESDTIQFITTMFDSISSDTIHAVWLSTSHQLHDTIQILIAMTSVDTDDASSDNDNNILSMNSYNKSTNNKHNKYTKIQLQPGINNKWLSHSTQSFSDRVIRPDLSSTWKLDALAKAYPTLDIDDIESTFYMNNYNFKKSMIALNEIYPNTCRDHTIDIQPGSDDETNIVNHTVPNNSINTSKRSNVLNDIYCDREYNELCTELSDWLNCQISATRVYSDIATAARNNASIATVQRQAIYNAAATSYIRRKMVDAAQYSRKGKQYTNTIDTYNKQAMYATFLQYNYKLSTKKSQIDLHGLYVREVQYILPFILYHCKLNQNKSIDIITGAGKHSYNKQSRLKPCVVQILIQLEYTYNIINDAVIRCRC